MRRSYRGQRKVRQLYKHSWIAESDDEAEDAEFEDIGDDEALPKRSATPDSDDEVWLRDNKEWWSEEQDAYKFTRDSFPAAWSALDLKLKLSAETTFGARLRSHG